MIENIFCKKLNLPIPFKTTKPISSYKKYVRESHFDPLDANQTFLEWIDNLNLYLADCRVFNALPFVWYDPHKDISIESEALKRHVDCIKINIIFNANGSKMIWYKLKQGAVPFFIKNRVGEMIKVYPYKIIDPVYEANTDDPAILINGMEIHTLQNGDTHRMCFSMPLYNKMTKKRISWDEANEILKDYLI
jgi:hypothetical protein